MNQFFVVSSIFVFILSFSYYNIRIDELTKEVDYLKSTNSEMSTQILYQDIEIEDINYNLKGITSNPPRPIFTQSDSGSAFIYQQPRK